MELEPLDGGLTLTATRVIVGSPSGFDFAIYRSDGDSSTRQCTLDGVPADCGALHAGPYPTHDEHTLVFERAEADGGGRCRTSMAVVGFPAAEDGGALAGSGAYLITTPTPSRALSDPNDDVWVGAGAVLSMQRMNYCLSSSAECLLVLDDGASLRVEGSNVNIGEASTARIVFGPGTTGFFHGSNVHAALAIDPTARVYQWNSNVFPRAFSLPPAFTLTDCPFATPPGCPANLTKL